jgi:hypothetical protein
MAFQGSLAELHLPDIIQLVSVSGKTGVFHLVDGPVRGEIYLNDGQIVHAQLDDISGEEAVYALAIWNRGEFRFDPGAPVPQRTITKSNTNLLMEAARRLDEWRVLSKKIPSTELVPEFVVLEGREGQINLNTSEWLILSKIDGTRSIKQIAGSCRLSTFDAAKILYGLVATGLLRLKEPPAGARSARASQPATGAKAGRESSDTAAAAAPGRPPAARPAPAVPAPPQPEAAATPAPDAAQVGTAADALGRLSRVREVCLSVLGAVGEGVVNKHYSKARADIERGAGVEAVEEAIPQIARAASILKGPAATEQLLEQLKGLR